jgi:hypothetical protein
MGGSASMSSKKYASAGSVRHFGKVRAGKRTRWPRAGNRLD